MKANKIVPGKYSKVDLNSLRFIDDGIVIKKYEIVKPMYILSMYNDVSQKDILFYEPTEKKAIAKLLCDYGLPSFIIYSIKNAATYINIEEFMETK